MTAKAPRKITHLAATPAELGGHTDFVWAACDDGTFWEGSYADKDGQWEFEWIQLPPIPQDEPALETQA